jgi:hypothetical protein
MLGAPGRRRDQATGKVLRVPVALAEESTEMLVSAPLGAETRIRNVSRRSIPSVDALPALAHRPPAHPPTGPPKRHDDTKDLEILILRQQLRVLRRKTGRPKLNARNRVLLAVASRVP